MQPRPFSEAPTDGTIILIAGHNEIGVQHSVPVYYALHDPADIEDDGAPGYWRYANSQRNDHGYPDEGFEWFPDPFGRTVK